MPRNQTWRACGVQSAMAVLAIALAGCTGHTPDSGESRYDGLPRSEFNRWAVRENRSLYWIADSNHDGRIQPDEVTKLLFYPPDGPWVENGRFTGRFDAAYAALVTAAQAAAGGTPTSDERRKLVAEDLDQGRSSLVSTDFSGYRPGERNFVGHMLNVAAMVDALYDLQTGATAVAGLVPADDAASQSLFRRNHGPACLAPRTQNNPQCSAIPGAPKPRVDVYPAALQQDAKFCTALERRPDAERLLDQFSVVRERNGRLVAVPYSEAYAPQMDAIAGELERAASNLDPQAEAALIKYLRAAAGSFRSNAWIPADEAWASMNAVNSKWYVRVGPDEVYWDPCASKAGFHLTFALINSGSLSWQQKLGPHQAAMEAMIAERAGAPYRARRVSFHLPDFIDIIVNAGNDRDALGATIGQSLPNWGPVADQGRGPAPWP